jgi:hypothetical protein
MQSTVKLFRSLLCDGGIAALYFLCLTHSFHHHEGGELRSLFLPIGRARESAEASFFRSFPFNFQLPTSSSSSSQLIHGSRSTVHGERITSRVTVSYISLVPYLLTSLPPETATPFPQRWGQLRKGRTVFRREDRADSFTVDKNVERFTLAKNNVVKSIVGRRRRRRRVRPTVECVNEHSVFARGYGVVRRYRKERSVRLRPLNVCQCVCRVAKPGI